MFSVRPCSTKRTAACLRPPLRREIILSLILLYILFFYFIWSAIHGINSPFALSSGIPGRAATTQQSSENNKLVPQRQANVAADGIDYGVPAAIGGSRPASRTAGSWAIAARGNASFARPEPRNRERGDHHDTRSKDRCCRSSKRRRHHDCCCGGHLSPFAWQSRLSRCQ